MDIVKGVDGVMVTFPQLPTPLRRKEQDRVGEMVAKLKDQHNVSLESVLKRRRRG